MKQDIQFKEYEAGLPGTPDLEKISAQLPVKWSVFREKLIPRYVIVWRDIAICYLFLFSGIGSFIYLESRVSFLIAGLLSLLFGVWIGYWLHSLSLFLHEAVHFNVHPNKKWNDLLANLFICPLLFSDVQSYRKVHWPHHLNLGSPNDTEKSYFNRLTLSFLFQTLTGLYALKTLFYYAKLNGEQISKKKNRLNWNNLVRLVLTQSLILFLLVILGYPFVALAWSLGVIVFWPFFGTVRQILRHRNENADPSIDYYQIPHGAFMRLFGSDFFSRTFGNAGFNLHMLHHWDPHISYTRLRDMEEYFKQTELAPLIQNARISYWKFLWKLIKR